MFIRFINVEKGIVNIFKLLKPFMAFTFKDIKSILLEVSIFEICTKCH